MMNDQFDFDPATAAADFNTSKTGSSQQVAVPKKPLTKEEFEALLARWKKTFLKRAKRTLRSINTTALKELNIKCKGGWSVSSAGIYYYNLTFTDALQPEKQNTVVVEDNVDNESFSRNALFGFIKPDGSVTQYTYDNVLRSRVEKAISKVLYERLVDSNVDIDIEIEEAA